MSRIRIIINNPFSVIEAVIGTGMKCEDDNDIQVGDEVFIDTRYRGTVVANIESGEYSTTHSMEHWGYLKTGVLIDTDFGRTAHYEKEALITDEVKLRIQV